MSELLLKAARIYTNSISYERRASFTDLPHQKTLFSIVCNLFYLTKRTPRTSTELVTQTNEGSTDLYSRGDLFSSTSPFFPPLSSTSSSRSVPINFILFIRDIRSVNEAAGASWSSGHYWMNYWSEANNHYCFFWKRWTYNSNEGNKNQGRVRHNQ